MTEIWLSHMSSVASNTCLSSLTEVLAHLSTVSPLKPFCMLLMVMSIQPDWTHMWPTAGKKFAQHYAEENTHSHSLRDVILVAGYLVIIVLLPPNAHHKAFSHILRNIYQLLQCVFSLNLCTYCIALLVPCFLLPHHMLPQLAQRTHSPEDHKRWLCVHPC